MEIHIIQVISFHPHTPQPPSPQPHYSTSLVFSSQRPYSPDVSYDKTSSYCTVNYILLLFHYSGREITQVTELCTLLPSLNLYYSNLIQEGFLRSQTISRVLIYILSYSALMSPMRSFNTGDQTFFFWFLLHTAQ